MAFDRVLVRGIRLHASVGTEPWERQVRQPLEVDVEAEVDTSTLLRTGELSSGVDYNAVIHIVRSVVFEGHTDLVEVLADRIARELLAATVARVVRVQVRKYSACASDAAHVGVEVERRSDGLGS